MKKIIRNERGFLMLNVIFLTLITSLAAMILINAAPRAHNPQSTLRLTALYLANEQFAMLESKAAEGTLTPGDYNFLGDPDDLKNVVDFNVETTVTGTGNLRVAKVKVSWSDEDKDYIEVERTIWNAENP